MDGPQGGVGRSSAALELPFPLPTDQILPTQPVGTLTGTLSAGLDGQASYTMPLAVPPGRAGMHPNLALTYNSGAGNGPLGMGFAIQGLTSSITRCVHPHEQGGARRVRFDAQGRFCLDGQPLVLLSGQYGGVGSEYRTERESARRIVLTYADGGGPKAFEVWEPDGRVLEYAEYVEGSHVHYEGFGEPEVPTIPGLVRVAWSLTRVRDRQGNAIELQYQTDFGGSDEVPAPLIHRLMRIDYTSGPMLAPQRSVRVVYESRSDVRDTYVAGVRLRIDYRVKRLELHAPSIDGVPERAWYYDFEYVLPQSPQATITGRSLLRSVTRCDADDVCLPPTTFDWSRGSFDYDTELRGEPGFFSTQVADVDGDGLDDVVTHDADRRASVQFTPNGTWSGGGGAAPAYTTRASTGAPVTIDVTGDGRAELFTSASDFTCWTDDECGEGLHCVHMGGPNRVGLCTGSCTPSCSVVPGSGDPPRYACDSIPCVSVTGEGVCNFFDEPDGPNEPGATPECVSDALVDGDGWRPNFYHAGSTELAMGLRIGGHAFLRTDGLGSLNFGDFHGDGDPDALIRDDEASWWVGRNSRDPSEPFEPIWPYAFDPRGAMAPIPPLDSASDEHEYGAVTEIVDLDGDGRTDVLIPVFSAIGSPVAYHQVTLGPTNTDPAEVVATNLTAHSRDQLLLDVNGDGLLDAVDLGSPSCASPLGPRCAWVPVPGDVSPYRLAVRINTGNGFTPREEGASGAEYVPFWPEEVDPPLFDGACDFDPEHPPHPDCRPDSVPWYAADLRYRVLDYNQDGLTDFIRLGPNPQVYVSDGRAFHPRPLPFGFNDTLVETPFEPRKRTEFHVADFNGDHQPDFLVSSPYLSQMTVYLSTGGQADLLVRVTSGVGATEQIEYETLSDEAVYDDRFDFADVSDGPARCGYPYACVDRGMTVVHRLRYAIPGHPERLLTYSYAGARRDARTREHLGFARVYTEDSASGEATEVWIDNTLELEQAAARGAFHPLAFKASRVYSALQVGDRAHVTRIDYRYRSEDSPMVEGGFEHRLVGHGLARGYRAAVRDMIVRSYEDSWSDFAAGADLTLSQRYREMRARGVRAWRSDRREYDYRPVECGEMAPCAALDAPLRFSYPSAWTDTTYRGDLAGSLVDDLPDVNDGSYTLDVEFFQRTAMDRSFDEASWLIGLPAATETERCTSPETDWLGHLHCPPASGEPDVVRRRVKLGYDTNLVTSIIREPHADPTDDDGNPTGLTLTTTLGYDHGNLVSVTEASPEGETRVREVTFDDDELVFPIAFTSHVGGLALTRWVGWHPALGVPLVTQAPNGARSHARYDGLGRPRGTRAPGAASWVSIDYGATGGPGMEVGVTGSSVPHSVTTLDALLRPIGRSHKAFLGADVAVSMTYDALGRLVSTTRPHFAGEDPTSVESTFDSLGRLTTTRYREHPSASAETLATYDYRLEAATPSLRVPVARGKDALGNESETWQDLRGLLTRTRQRYTPEGGTPRWIDTRFQHDLHGTARTVMLESDELGSRDVRDVSHVDRLGRPTRIVDPDRGELKLFYNSFDELVVQADALGKTELFYDELGRLTERRDADGTTNWIWDTATNGEGLLAASLSADNVTITYEYDAHGRLTYQIQDDGRGPPARFDYTYDAEGRLRDVFYPENAVGARFSARYEYDGAYLAQILDSKGDALWKAQERHADGRVRREVFGNGITTLREYDPRTRRLSRLEIGSLADVSASYDELGRLEDRSDTVTGRSEHFEHDALGRLRRWDRVTASGATRLSYAYDDGGNLLEVRDIDTGSLEAELQYGVDAGPHAATKWNGEVLEYDALGRQRRGIGGRLVEYTARDLPRRVVDGGVEVLYEYDAQGRRARARGDADITYAGGLYERRGLAGGGTAHICYVPGPEGIVAQITMADLSSDTVPTYFHHDGLGSITVTTDKNGDLVERQWFSPFGRALHDDGSYADALGTSVSRGFTGHEHDDVVGLINMQGRIYDPRLARFLTTDPLIGEPAHSQAWNPYSYVMNAPLDFIDPSGFDPVYIEFEDHHVHVDRRQLAAERHMQMLDRAMTRAEAGAGTASTQPGAAPSGAGSGRVLSVSGPDRVLSVSGPGSSDIGSLAAAYGDGVTQGTWDLVTQIVLGSAGHAAVQAVRAVGQPAVQAPGNPDQQGDGGAGLLDILSDPAVSIVGIVDMLANGSPRDIARNAGLLTPAAVAAIVARPAGPAPGGGGTRFIANSAGRTLDLRTFLGLTRNPGTVAGGRSGTGRALQGPANSFSVSGGGHAYVYGSDGRLMYDVSARRIKMFLWDQAPNGQWFARTGSDLKFFQVPQSLLRALGL